MMFLLCLLAAPALAFLNLNHKNVLSSNIIANPRDVQVNWGNGLVISNVEVNPIYVGAFDHSTKMDAFFKNIVQSDYFSALSQYSTPNAPKLDTYYGTFGKSIQINSTEYSQITSITSVVKLLKSLVKAGRIQHSDKTYFPIFFGPEYDSVLGDCNTFCSYHHGFIYGKAHVFFSVQPHCSNQCCSTANVQDSLTCVASHNLVETVTNPSFKGWVSTEFQEVGDICADKPANIVGKDGVSYVVNQFWSMVDDRCVSKSDRMVTGGVVSHNMQAALAVSRRGGAVGIAIEASSEENLGVVLTPQVPIYGSKCDVLGMSACQRIDGVGKTFICAYGYDDVWRENLHWVEWYPYCDEDKQG